MKIKIHLTTPLLFIVFASLTGCENEKSIDLPSEYVKFELDGEEKIYPGPDGIFQSCDPLGNGDYNYSFSKSFKSQDNEFYSFGIGGYFIYSECPTTEIYTGTRYSLSLSKKLDSGDFVDYIYRGKESDLNLVQKFTENKLELSGKFTGQFYQLHKVRPGSLPSPEGYPIDSLLIKNVEFRFSIK